MKKVTRFLLSAITTLSCGMLSNYAQAVDMGNLAPDAGENVGLPAEVIDPELPANHFPLYRVTYMSSQTATANRSATVISITNNSFVTCGTSVDWRIGFGGTACTTTLVLGPGQTGEHCTRPLPGAVSACNATCSPTLTNTEGSAIVGIPATSGCANIAVSGRTYYTTGINDTGVAAVTDAKVVKIRNGNIGD